jgi:hypothetical protein
MIHIDLQRIVQVCSLLFAVLTVCVSFFLLFTEVPQTIVFDGTQFRPQELTIERGMRVVFKNESQGAFWPASSLHPYHTVYSDFDPKKPIPQDSSWSFIFNAPGTWSFHDHMRPYIKGVIKVKTDDAVIPPPKCDTPSELEECQERDMITVLHEGGLPAAFDFVATLYEQDKNFQQGCHETLHSLGRESYDLYANGTEVSFSEVTTYCGYGFFHGFIEGVIARTGSLDDAEVFCEGFEEQGRVNATEACYHGIGHGVLDGSDPRTWGKPMQMVEPALLICEKVSSSELQQSNCAFGVFNALADFLVQGMFNLSLPPEEAYAFCAQVVQEKFKKGCYSQMNVITGYQKNRSLAQSLEFLDGVTEEAYLEIVVRSLGGAHSKSSHGEAQYKEIIETCYTLEDALTLSCLQGYVGRLMDFGPIGDEYQLGVTFCNSSTLLPKEKRGCVEFVGKTAGLDQTVEVRDARCDYIKAHTGIEDLSCEPY